MQNEDFDTETLSYLKTLTLLCVEDDKTTKLVYETILTNLVEKIIYAADGEEGYQKYLDENIDIIITDYNMPNCNGLEMVAKIRKDDKVIPISLVSAIEDIDIVVKSLNLGVNHFIKKPIRRLNIIKSLEQLSKLVIANNVIEKQKEKEVYRSYQENLGFSKELNILRNDFYYQMVDTNGIQIIDFLYKPLDVLSGDAYCARRIDENTSFYLMVDGMGKGLSASLTAMIMTSFVNHIIDKMLFLDSFDLSILVHETMEYIKPVLLEDEALALDYVVTNCKDKMLYYAKFAMPVLLMEDSDSKLIRLKSNNPPLSKWNDTFNIDSFDTSKVKKILIYSDGVVENETIFDGRAYSEFIEKDFQRSFTREELKESFFSKIKEQEDDITLIYLHCINSEVSSRQKRIFDSTLKSTEEANEWFEDICTKLIKNTTEVYKAGLVFTELYMNAYEHGSLGIDVYRKNNLLEEDIYFETLLEEEKECNKKISVEVDTVIQGSNLYMITSIADEGKGFDTQILSDIFRNSTTFNGRGVFVSRKNSLGIYYNKKGNRVVFLNKVQIS